MPILNFGSLNIDRVLRVAHIVRPGETVAGTSLAEFAGGKGANQSVALARASAQVAHFGKIGPDGAWLKEKLAREGIDTCRVLIGPRPTGHAAIQVDDAGQNAIVVLGGANDEITVDEVDRALEGCARGDWLLAQNETSAVEHAIRRAAERGMRVALNPAPFNERVRRFPFEHVDLLCVNETEGAALTGCSEPAAICAALTARWPKCEIVLTLGAAGVLRGTAEGMLRYDAPAVTAIDTTAAGDTFLGYYLARRAGGHEPRESLELACRAAALCVTRPGAMDSIPHLAEVQNL